jgi:3-hydroxyacyl-CoA dehydrogenase
MGSGIAAHFANAGVPTLLLDIVPKAPTDDEQKRGLTLESREVRNRIAQAGLTKALSAKPAAFFSKVNADLVTVGNFDDDLGRIADCDIVVEAVVENMDIKRSLFQRVAAVRGPNTIIASNTSGLSLAKMSEGLPAEFQKHFLVMHFFNPPRYMRLLEVVRLPQTSAEVFARAVEIGEALLGKGIVYGKDTTNFIANRIGVFAMLHGMHLMVEEGYSPEEVDAVVGKALGRPKSAAFRTGDVVGIDTLVHVSQNCYDTLPADEQRETFRIPEFVQAMVKKGLLGDKTGGGFYKRVRGDGGSKILTLDPKTLEYRDQQKVRYDSLGMARNIDDVAERIRTVAFAEDRAGQFAWKNLSATLVYAANRIPEIADDIVQVDSAMRWGFNWDLGPFEVWDALGVEKVAEKLEAEGRAVPKIVADLLASGHKSFYESKDGVVRFFDAASKKPKVKETPKHHIVFKTLADQKKVVRENGGATLYDIGDGVLGLEFHTKMNAIDNDIIDLLHAAADDLDAAKHEALVIANDGGNFSAGANLMLILMVARSGDFKAIEEVSKRFQDATLRLRYGNKPVVAAPFGLTLGGGAEVTFSASRVVAHAETYMGLVEVGVGLIPAAGGTREMVFRALEAIPPGVDADPFPFLRKAFETIAMAKVATSAQEAQEMRLMRPSDRIVLSRDRLTFEAKKTALALCDEGYRPLRPRTAKLPGKSGYATLMTALHNFRAANQITEHDFTVASKLAWVMMGGDVSPQVAVGEQYLLDLEREAFLSLAGNEKSQERMQHMLMTGKPLRN